MNTNDRIMDHFELEFGTYCCAFYSIFFYRIVFIRAYFGRSFEHLRPIKRPVKGAYEHEHLFNAYLFGQVNKINQFSEYLKS